MFPCGRYAKTVIKEVVISGTVSSYLSLQIENVQYITCSDTVAHITK